MTEKTELSRRTYNCNDGTVEGYTPWGDGYDWIEFLGNQPKTRVVAA
jgi:hypothetical protein